MHTEEEAGKHWCPHAVASHTDPRRGFHGTDDDQHGATFPCIASRCMAWRWAVAMTYPDNPDTLAERPTVKVRTFPTKALCETFYEQEAGCADSGLVGGFCGLAGNPA